MALRAALLLAGCRAGRSAEGGEVAQSYLSEDYFPGLHILAPRQDVAAAADWSLTAYRGGQLPEMPEPFNHGLRPLIFEGPATMAELRKALERSLAIPQREELELDWQIFDRQGQRLDDLEGLRSAEVAFLIEIGVWMWPAVRVGFKQEAIGVGNSTAVLTTLSLRPKIFEVRHFLSDAETQEVMDLGAGQGLFNSEGMMQSADLEKGTAHSQFRTSKQAWLSNELSPLMGELDERVASLTRVPSSHNEAAQLLSYDQGTFYHNHMDWAELELYPDQKDMWIDHHMGHQDRLATVFWYLNDVPQGGETNFPKAGQTICGPLERGGPAWRHCKGTRDPPAHSCREGFKVKPQKGTVVMWYNYHASGRGDANALHAGCPVGRGLIKWSANKWVNIKPLSERGRWVKKHPAIKRLGWKGSKGKKDPNKCVITFNNDADEAAEIIWQEPGEIHRLGMVEDGLSTSMDSQRGHQFFMEAGGKKSNVIKCEPPDTSATLTSEFWLEVGARKEL